VRRAKINCRISYWEVTNIKISFGNEEKRKDEDEGFKGEGGLREVKERANRRSACAAQYRGGVFVYDRLQSRRDVGSSQAKKVTASAAAAGSKAPLMSVIRAKGEWIQGLRNRGTNG